MRNHIWIVANNGIFLKMSLLWSFQCYNFTYAKILGFKNAFKLYL